MGALNLFLMDYMIALEMRVLEDLGRLRVEGTTIYVAAHLMRLEYGELAGRTLQTPSGESACPWSNALQSHAAKAKQFGGDRDDR